MKKTMRWVAASVMMAALGFFGVIYSESPQLPIGSAIAGAEDAIQQAIAYTGFAASQDPSILRLNSEIVKTTPMEAELNLLHRKGAADTIWHVILKDVKFTPRDKDRPSREQKMRDFHIWIDSRSGKLLRIWSELPDTIGAVKCKPFYIKLETMIQPSQSLSSYIGFPDSLPPQTLYDILQAVDSEPFNRPEIVAYYLLESTGGSTPEPVWVIDIRGVPPMGKLRVDESKSDWGHNHIRRVIGPPGSKSRPIAFYTSKDIPADDTLDKRDQK
jgi:hypothetical protein